MADSSLRLLKGTLDVLILKTLSWGPAHGYAISRWIHKSSADDLRIEEGALYPALRRLEERGWIESTWKVLESGREHASTGSPKPAGVACAPRWMPGSDTSPHSREC